VNGSPVARGGGGAGRKGENAKKRKKRRWLCVDLTKLPLLYIVEMSKLSMVLYLCPLIISQF